MDRNYLDGGKNIHGLSLGFSTWVISVGVMVLYIIPGTIYRHGMGSAWFALGLGGGLFLSWSIISYRLMLYATKEKGVALISEFLDERYKKRSLAGALSRLIIACFSFAMMIFTVSFFLSFLENILPGKGLIILIAILVTINIYTIFFGIKGIADINLVKGTVIFAAIAMLLVSIWFILGRQGLLEGLFVSHPKGGMTNFLDATCVDGEPLKAMDIVSDLSWMLVVPGIPNITNLYMAYGNTRDLSKGRIAAMIATSTCLFASGVLAVFLRAYLADGSYAARNLSMNDVVKNTMNSLGQENNLFGWTRLVFLFAIVAAVMSIIDSCLHLFTSIVSTRIMNGRKERERHSRTYILSVSTIALFISLLVGLYAEGLEMYIFKFALMETGCILAPVIFMALYDRRSNEKGILCGMISGAAVPLAWNYATFIKQGDELLTLYEYTGLYGILPSIAFSIVLIWIISRLTKDVDTKVKEEFDEVKKHIEI